VDGDTVMIAFRYSFHKDQLDTPQNQRIVGEALSQVLDGACRARFILTAEESPPRPQTDRDRAVDDPVVQAAVRMGGRVANVQREESTS
jgi:starvation-inducible outer membrane lipoprotein